MKKRIYLVVIPILILVDQIIKYFIYENRYNNFFVFKNIFAINYCENTGIAFGFGSENRIVFIALGVVILSAVFLYFINRREVMSKIEGLSLCLILSGGLSNFFDRIFRGFVIDYIDITQIINYPIFNFADICIVVGCISFCIYIIKGKKEVIDGSIKS